MNTQIREVTPSEYAAVVELRNRLWPTRPDNVEALASAIERTRQHPQGLQWQQWLAWEESQAVGFALAKQWAGWYHPDRYSVTVEVLPEWRRRGIGTALTATLRQYLEGRQARELHCGAWEYDTSALQMLAQYGFREISRTYQSCLTVAEAQLVESATQLLPAGWRLLNWSDWTAEAGEDEAVHRLLPCLNEARLDEPTGSDVDPLNTEELQRSMAQPSFFPEGFLLVLTDTGEVAAFTSLWHDRSDPERLNTGLTGTARHFRRQGLARTLKEAAIKVASQRGATHIWTDNDSRNTGMLAINHSLGFQPEPAYVSMQWGSVKD